jgi:hypothetical protein
MLAGAVFLSAAVGPRARARRDRRTPKGCRLGGASAHKGHVSCGRRGGRTLSRRRRLDWHACSSSRTGVWRALGMMLAVPGLSDEVRRRAAQEQCCFVLLVPRPYWDPETEEAALTLELAIPLLEEAAGGHVEGRIGDSDPLVAVRETLEREPFDEASGSRRSHSGDGAPARSRSPVVAPAGPVAFGRSAANSRSPLPGRAAGASRDRSVTPGMRTDARSRLVGGREVSPALLSNLARPTSEGGGRAVDCGQGLPD